MSDESRDPQSAEAESDSVRKLKDFVIPAVWIGYVLALAGVGIGGAMALQRHQVACDEAFRCYTHPQALEGSAIVIIAILLAILIGITGAIARAVLSDRPTTP